MPEGPLRVAVPPPALPETAPTPFSYVFSYARLTHFLFLFFLVNPIRSKTSKNDVFAPSATSFRAPACRKGPFASPYLPPSLPETAPTPFSPVLSCARLTCHQPNSIQTHQNRCFRTLCELLSGPRMPEGPYASPYLPPALPETAPTHPCFPGSKGPRPIPPPHKRGGSSTCPLRPWVSG